MLIPDHIIPIWVKFLISRIVLSVLSEVSGRESTRVDSFVTGLSSVNFVFALAMNLFNFTVLYLLTESSISIVYGGLGISVGQAILIFAVIPIGRLIDKGKAYILMATGALLYASVLMILYFATTGSTMFYFFLATAMVAAVVIFQNMFKSSLSSFVAKAVKENIMGKSYSRVIWMEAAGGTASFFIIFAVIFAKLPISLGLVYLAIAAILFVVSAASITILARENRAALRLAVSKVKRPSFIESLRTLRERGRFTATLLSTKVLMSIGVLGFSYFYIIIGRGIGVSLLYSLLFLGIASAVGIGWGVFSERFTENHPQWGKSYIVIMAALDVVSYILVLIALYDKSVILFLAAPIVGSPGPFLVPGALAFEVKGVGKENRGMFAGIQRTFTGIPAVALGAPLTFLFTISPIYMWGVIVASSVATLIFAVLIPSRKFMFEKYGIGDATASE